MFTKEVEDALMECGRNYDRKSYTSIYDQLRHMGYEIFECAAEFLSRFGGTKIKITDTNVLNFDPISAARLIDVEHKLILQRRASEKLLPIGEAYHGGYILLLSESGKIYGAFEDLLLLEGNSYTEAIKNLYYQSKPQEVFG